MSTVPALRSRLDRIVIFLATGFLGAGLSLGWNPLHWAGTTQIVATLVAAVGTLGLWRFPREIIDHPKPTL